MAGFHKKELELAVEAYNKRDRRFGGLKEERIGCLNETVKRNRAGNSGSVFDLFQAMKF
mgnify:CR=1 FL=1